MAEIQPTSKNDISTRGITNANLANFKGKTRQVVINVDEGMRPVVMDGITLGGKFHCASLEELDAVKTTAEGALTKAQADTFYLGIGAKAVSATTADTATTCTGNSATANKLVTARNINITGNATGTTSFDGSGDVSINLTVSESAHAVSADNAIKDDNQNIIKNTYLGCFSQTFSEEQKEQLKINLGLDTLISTIYPVGSIYISVLDVNPNILFGGSWEKIQNAFLYGSGNKVLGTSGGSETVTLKSTEMPSHNHGIGSQNITGSFNAIANSNTDSEFGLFRNFSGAFSGTKRNGVNTNRVAYYGTASADTIKFTGSSGMTGSTASTGGGSAHENMPPYLVVNIWKRIS